MQGALARTYDLAGEGLMHTDPFSMYIDRLYLSPLLALASASATVSTVGFMQVSCRFQDQIQLKI